MVTLIIQINPKAATTFSSYHFIIVNWFGFGDCSKEKGWMSYLLYIYICMYIIAVSSLIKWMIDAAYAQSTHPINELWNFVSKFTCNFCFIKEMLFVTQVIYSFQSIMLDHFSLTPCVNSWTFSGLALTIISMAFLLTHKDEHIVFLGFFFPKVYSFQTFFFQEIYSYFNFQTMPVYPQRIEFSMRNIFSLHFISNLSKKKVEI